MNTAADIALETLLKVQTELAPGLSETLLRRCYEIQLRHQFDDDRDQSVTALERAIDDAVNHAL